MSEIIIKKKVKTDTINGVITLAALSYEERIKISEEAITDIAPGEKSFEVQTKGNLERSKTYYELAKKQVKTVDLKIKDEDGEEETVTSIDHLMIFEDGTALVMDIASDLIGGLKLGNGKLKTSDKIA